MIKKLLIFAFLSYSVMSCKKPHTDGQRDMGKLSTLSGQYNFSNYPQIDRGRLVFTDYNHFDAYLTFLGKAVEGAPDEHIILQEIEDGLGFTSLRKIAHDQFIQLNQVGWSTLREIPDEHFVVGSDLRSILNTSLDMQIGQEIIHYVNKNFAVVVKEGHEDVLDQFKALNPETSTLNDLLTVDDGREYSGVIRLTGEGYIPMKGTGTPGLHGPTLFQVGTCTDPGAYYFRDIYAFDGSRVKSWVKVDFDDGSALGYYGPVLSLAGWKVENFTHTFPTPNNVNHYNIKMYAYDNSNYTGTPFDQKTVPLTITIPPSCLLAFKDSDWHYLNVPSTDRWVSGKLVMQNIGGSNNPRLRVVAYSRLIKKLANGNYTTFKGEMYVTLACDAKDPTNCSTVDQLVGDGWDSYDDEQTLHRQAAPGAAWYTANSTHGYKYNGTWYTLPINLNVCN
ncbi:hypothetical protein DBR32_14255 [Taibaiella sp. KBW10]|uniref:hypothetical protein n=1 Tax=Taibaiella sp. KBW10 TaxID=2153357 RepID=UPI000F59AB52|nr:hypothetical protein [Taibaiella sp. KBW10]RQO29745.1 hypothetical protein DBR32_14255 [Taibaiella sp. KBW10]